MTTTPFEPIAGLFERNLNVRHVYAEPVRHGDTTVIPVAKVAYGFGAGGRGPAMRLKEFTGQKDEAPAADAQGGGGGGARLTPIGALEIGPQGTRFIRYDELPRLVGAFALGLVAGVLLALRLR